MAINQMEIKEEAERFFSEFLYKTPDGYQGVTEDELRDLLEFRCTEEESSMLEARVTEEEIRKVLFAMPSESPGPDVFLVNSSRQPGRYWLMISRLQCSSCSSLGFCRSE